MLRYIISQTLLLFLTKIMNLPQVSPFQPFSKEEQLTRIKKMNEEVEPFRKNLTECAHQVKAKATDVEDFLKRIPQSTAQGKCFVACILKRNELIKNNKIQKESLIEVNRAVYGDDSEVMARLKTAIIECEEVVSDIFEICEYASMFNDCMHMKMEHILDKVTMDRRMKALGQMASADAYTDDWTEDDDEILQLLKDEL